MAQAFYSFLFGILGVVIGWPIVEFVARPFRQFFDIRRQVCAILAYAHNIFEKGEDRAKSREQVEKSLGIKSIE